MATMIPKLLNLKDDLYNCLKSHKVWRRLVKPFFEIFSKTPQGPTVQIGFKKPNEQSKPS